MRSLCRRCGYILLYLSVAACVQLVAQEKRPLTPDDLFKIEVGPSGSSSITVSPDGEWLAYVQWRSRLPDRGHAQDFLAGNFGNDRADVWLARVESGAPINLTRGEADSSGYWNPKWSPNGEYLAMLSTKGGDNVRLWIWERATGRLENLSNRGVAQNSDGQFEFSWLDNRRLVAVLLPDGEQPWGMSFLRQAARVAMREWPKAWAGKEPTASVLESGVPVDLVSYSQEQVTSLDVGGRAISLGLTVEARNVLGSPDGRYIAYGSLVHFVQPDPETSLAILERNPLNAVRILGRRYQLAIADTKGRSVHFAAMDTAFIIPNSFRWAPEGGRFAFLGARAGEEKRPLQLFRGSVDGAIEAIPLSDSDPRDIVWVDGDRLLVSAECQLPSAPASKGRIDWWVVVGGKAPRNLTEHLKTVPGELFSDSTGRNFVGMADGEVWRLNVDSGERTNLTAELDAKLAGITWPSDSVDRSAGFAYIIVSALHGQLIDYFRLDLASGRTAPLARPSDFAMLVAYAPKSDISVFAAEERTGTYLTLVHGQQRRALIQTNTFLSEIAEGPLRQISYNSLDGQSLKGWILLPPSYESGKHYPLVTLVYGGTTYGDRTPGLSRINERGVLWNMQLLAARGYMVLFPSMPLRPYGDVDDPLLKLTNGVLPAVSKAIDLGLADPDRLAVMGQSYGGFSTYGLVTQTNRFKAAIASAGFNDLISYYGTFTGYDKRYGSGRYFGISVIGGFEAGQPRMGNPPWNDWGRYERNSPLFYVDRVQTPLLIVHGEVDSVPMEQAEEFFTALYRQGKRARFIRYWGEGHVLESPANVRDFWHQAYAWLDEFCDISRDAKGNLVLDGDRVKSRNGAPPLKPEDFARFNEIDLKSQSWLKEPVVVSHTQDRAQERQKSAARVPIKR